MTVLTDSLERFARLSPSRLSVNDNGERIDFHQLAQRIRKTTDWLARSGIAPVYCKTYGVTRIVI